jgi:hypothetical protein
MIFWWRTKASRCWKVEENHCNQSISLPILNATQEMAMKSAATFVMAAIFLVAVVAASAKTVTTSQGNVNDQSVNAVAGPPPVHNTARDKSSAQPSKKALRKSRIRTPPPPHDPN